MEIHKIEHLMRTANAQQSLVIGFECEVPSEIKDLLVAFPTSFPTACATVDVTFSQATAPASNALACVIPHTITKSGCSASCRYSLNGGAVGSQTSGFIEWIAIGY